MIHSSTTRTVHISIHSNLKTASLDCPFQMRKKPSNLRRRWTSEKRMPTKRPKSNPSRLQPDPQTVETTFRNRHHQSSSIVDLDLAAFSGCANLLRRTKSLNRSFLQLVSPPGLPLVLHPGRRMLLFRTSILHCWTNY